MTGVLKAEREPIPQGGRERGRKTGPGRSSRCGTTASHVLAAAAMPARRVPPFHSTTNSFPSYFPLSLLRLFLFIWNSGTTKSLKS